MAVTPWTSEEIDQRQLEVLWDSMADNSLMKYSPVGNLNKQLNTDGKNVIKAINELLVKLKQNDTTVVSFNKKFNELVGNADTAEEKADWDNLFKIDRNVIKAIYKIYLSIVGSNTTDISHLAPSVNEAILELNDTLIGVNTRLGIIEEKLDDEEINETLHVNSDVPNVLYLSHIPNDRSIVLEINGVDYNEIDAFTVDRLNKTLTWVFSSDNDGFDLVQGFSLKCHYYYENDQSELTIK